MTVAAGLIAGVSQIHLQSQKVRSLESWKSCQRSHTHSGEVLFVSSLQAYRPMSHHGPSAQQDGWRITQMLDANAAPERNRDA